MAPVLKNAKWPKVEGFQELSKNQKELTVRLRRGTMQQRSAGWGEGGPPRGACSRGFRVQGRLAVPDLCCGLQVKAGQDGWLAERAHGDRHQKRGPQLCAPKNLCRYRSRVLKAKGR